MPEIYHPACGVGGLLCNPPFAPMTQRVTITEVTIHPPGELAHPDALILGLEPCGDVLILRQGHNCVELDADDLPLLLEQGQRLLEQGQ